LHRIVCNFPRQYLQALFSIQHAVAPSHAMIGKPVAAVTCFDAGVPKKTPTFNDAREFRRPPLKRAACFRAGIAPPHARSGVKKNVAAASSSKGNSR